MKQLVVDLVRFPLPDWPCFNGAWFVAVWLTVLYCAVS
jgi:hypothetical protein